MESEIVLRELRQTLKDIIEEIISLVTECLSGKHSRKSYKQSLEDLLRWCNAQGKSRLSKRIVQNDKRNLQERTGGFQLLRFIDMIGKGIQWEL